MADPYATLGATPTAPARKCFDITPSNDADLPNVPKALYCNGAGTVKVTLVDGGTSTFTVSGAGPLDVSPVRVWATDTTVASLIGLL